MLNINIITFFLLLISFNQYSANVTETISRQKCREYGQNLNSCHHSNDEVVQNGQFPHIVSIGYNVENEIKYKCSGVLISDQYIITTAYCGLSRVLGPAVSVNLGVLNLKDTKNETHIQEIKIINMFKHPMHKFTAKYNDISLLKLEHPVEINEYVRPACLPDLNEKPDKYILTGWEVFDSPEPTFFLTTHSDVFEVSNKECNSIYKRPDRQLKNGIDDVSQFCAGPSEIVCKMLGGAPLQSLDKNVNCMYDIHGLSSFGTRCPSPSPTVFTKITPYIKWIENIVWP